MLSLYQCNRQQGRTREVLAQCHASDISKVSRRPLRHQSTGGLVVYKYLQTHTQDSRARVICPMVVILVVSRCLVLVLRLHLMYTGLEPGSTLSAGSYVLVAYAHTGMLVPLPGIKPSLACV